MLVRFTLQSLQKSISIWRSHQSNHTTISGHNNATFRKSYILPFLTFFFLFFFWTFFYSFSFFCFWMYMYNMLLRFEKKIFCHIRTRYVYRKYIFLCENKLCSLFFLNTFYGLNCIKVINFSSLYQTFSVRTKQGNDSNVNLYYTIRFPYFISLRLFLFYFCN
jgi:hypothetical protein